MQHEDAPDDSSHSRKQQPLHVASEGGQATSGLTSVARASGGPGPLGQAHRERALAVARRIAERPLGTLVTIRKDTPGHSVRDARYKEGSHAVDVSDLRHVLSIDPIAMTAQVEGQVLIGDLCRATLAFGLVPRVVPEFADFTIAGLLCGEGIQSSSHRFGAFSQTISDVEVALGDGSLVHASSTEHAELFRVLPESLGTLGVVTAATIQLTPGARYVRSTYQVYTSADAYIDAFVSGLERSAFHE